ncbi:MAG: hypothetical protein IK115_07080 [Lachnospiraceae bacterium]|nr:hypothetical protein [Lachnospiraceae bacterium]
MDEREWNIFCEYVLLPRIAFLEKLSEEAGVSGYRSINADGTPVYILDTATGSFMLQYEELEIDWEALEELEKNAAALMIRILPLPWTESVSEKLGYMVIPEESLSEAEDLSLLAAILENGIWAKTARIPECPPEAAYETLARMNALEEALCDEELDHADVQIFEGEWPELLLESDSRVFGLSFLPFDDTESYLLQIRYFDEARGEYLRMMFPERGGIRPSGFYEKELGIFERCLFEDDL